MRHEYRIEGHVNGRVVDGSGYGQVDSETGESITEATFTKRAQGWDPRTIALMCCDRGSIMATKAEGSAVSMFDASGGTLTIGRHLVNAFRQGYIRDASGVVYADVRASSQTDIRMHAERKFDCSRIEGGVSNFEPGVNGIQSISGISGVMFQAGPKLVVVCTTYEVLTEDGKQLYGHTFYPHYLPDQRKLIAAPQGISVEVLEQQFDGKVLFNHLRTRTFLLTDPRLQFDGAHPLIRNNSWSASLEITQ